MRLVLGQRIPCEDGALRELSDVVVDGRSGRVTHVVVQPPGRPEGARLVSLELVGGDGEGAVLRSSAEALESLEPVRAYASVPAGERPEAGSGWSVGVEDVLVVPTYAPLDVAEPELGPNVDLLYDRVPRGEVELRSSSSVYSADRHRLGSVHAVELDERGRIDALILRRGHLWWRRDVSVPADAIASLETDVATLAIAKRELR